MIDYRDWERALALSKIFPDLLWHFLCEICGKWDELGDFAKIFLLATYTPLLSSRPSGPATDHGVLSLAPIGKVIHDAMAWGITGRDLEAIALSAGPGSRARCAPSSGESYAMTARTPSSPRAGAAPLVTWRSTIA
jgi:hypothetical protein